MFFTKRVLLSLIALLALGSAPAVFASDLVSQMISTGTIVVTVVDQNDREISGLWFLHQGTTKSGAVIRNGSFGETFREANGNYFLTAEPKRGYERFEITSENPQTLIPKGTIAFTLVYYEDGYAASREAQAVTAPGSETPTPAVPATPAPTVQPTTPAPAVEPSADTDVPTADQEVLDLLEKKYFSEPPAQPAPKRSPLRVAPPARPVTTAVPTLVATGPAAFLLPLFAISLLGALGLRRKN